MILRLWLLILCVCAGAFAPSRADAREAENRIQVFFGVCAETPSGGEPQAAETHGESLACGYETASASFLAAESVVANPAGKLTYDAAAKTWTSPGGLVYGQGSAHGNRVMHVMDHTVANASKPVHSVFSAPRNQVIGLVDEAWAARSGAGTLQANGNRVWTVDMGRQVGTGGQTSVQIVVRDGTTEIITAFPK